MVFLPAILRLVFDQAGDPDRHHLRTNKTKAFDPVAGITVLQAFEKARWYLRKAADMSVQPILSLRKGHTTFASQTQSELRFLDKGK